MTVKYRCSNCSYMFEMASDRSVLICPYCNKKTLKTLSRGPNFVDKLIEES